MSPYDTEYNDFCGGVINIVTKSGENEFHGSSYYYFKDDSLRGNKSKELVTNPVFEEKTYGATFSGPIIEDTLFFFVGYDKIERQTPISIGVGEGTAPNTFTFQVEKKPMRAEIDRDHLFIDRVMDDNGKKVDIL